MDKKALRRAWMRMCVPAALEQSALMIGALLLMLQYGRIGTDAVAILGAGGVLFGLMQGLVMMVCVGAFVVIARLMGRDNQHECKAVAASVLTATALLSFGIAGVCFAAAPWLARLCVGSDAELVGQTASYLRWLFLSFPLCGIGLASDNIMRGCGDMKRPLVYQVALNITQVVVCWVLLSRFDMGLTGVALAALAARGIEVALKGFAWLSGRNPLGMKYRPALQWRRLTRSLKVGAPVMIEQVVMQAGYLIASSLMIQMNTSIAAGYMLANSIISIIHYPFVGISTAIGATVGMALGREKLWEARWCARDCLLWAGGIGMVANIVLFFLYPTIARLYGADAELLQATLGLRLGFIVCNIFIGYCHIGAGVLKGAGDTRAMMVITNAGLYVRVAIIAAGVFWLPAEWALGAVGLSVAVDFLIRGGWAAVRVLRDRWLMIRI